MIKTLGLTALASCTLWAAPALAQSAASTSSLDIKVRGTASASQEAEDGTLFVHGRISSDFDWDAFESELIEQTGVRMPERHNDWSSVLIELGDANDTDDRVQILRYFEGTASEIVAADEHIIASGLTLYSVVSLNMDPTPETQRRAVEMATANAQEQAELVAISTGCRLDRLSSIELLRLDPNGRTDTPTLSLVSQDHVAQRPPRPIDAVPEASLEASISATFIAQCP